MTDEKPPMPAQPQTTQLPALTDRALLEDLGRVVREGFKRQDQRLDDIERQVDIAIEDNKQSNKRLTTLEVRLEEADRRAASSSIRAKSSSEVDQKHEAAIASLHEKTDAQTKDIADLKTTQTEQLDLLKKLTDTGGKLIANPYFRIICYGIAAYIASHLNIKLPVP